MKYYIREGVVEGPYNATSKARKDVDSILESKSRSRVNIYEKYRKEKT